MTRGAHDSKTFKDLVNLLKIVNTRTITDSLDAALTPGQAIALADYFAVYYGSATGGSSLLTALESSKLLKSDEGKMRVLDLIDRATILQYLLEEA